MGAIGVWAWLTASAAADRVLDKPAFTAGPDELLALARAAPPGDSPVVLLRDQVDTRYDDQGRAVMRWRWVFVVRTQAGVDEWGTLRAQWSPFHQRKPVVRARVIDPAGHAVELDPSLVTDAPAATGSSNVFSDRRYLEAPLPRLSIGAVVEEEVVTTDHEPLFAAGTVDLTPLGHDMPTVSTRISYTAPAARHVHHVARKLPAGVRARHEVSAGNETWVYESGALPPAPAPEPGVPSDVLTRPYVGVGTAASWAAVARAYRARVDARIAEGPVRLPAGVPATPSLETVEAITAWLHRGVRYTGIELGQASLVPWSPAETVKRGFGDCKDKATLLVALLRQAGIRAELALLSTGPGFDVDPDLPGMGAFDHAIVRARVAGRDVWIDATEDLVRPGQLPLRDQGRRALVIAEDTRGLTPTPAAAANDNFERTVRTFVAAEAGASQVTEVVRQTGVLDAFQRAWFRDTRAEDRKKTYDDHASEAFGGTVERAASSEVTDLTRPFETTLVVKGSRRVLTERDRIQIYLAPASVLEWLPSPVTSKPDTPRVQDFAWARPYVSELENRIEVPPGYTLPAAPSDRTVPLGPATFTERRRIEGRTLIVTFRFETGKPRVRPAELAAMQRAVSELREQTVQIQLEHTAFALTQAGKPREAIAECERLIALHPREGVHHAELAAQLLLAGAGEAARREARKAVALAPSDADLHAVLGWTLSHDTLGRPYAHDWDRAGALAALRQARKLDPAHLGAAEQLAGVLERAPSGERLGAGADLKAAAEAWRAALSVDKSDEHALALADVLLNAGQDAEAEKVARAAGPSEDRDHWIVSAVATARGAHAAIAAAAELATGPTRRTLISRAASRMTLLRRYDLARALFAEVGGLQAPGADALIAKVTAHPPIRQGTADPRAAVLDMLLIFLAPYRRTPGFWDAAVETEQRASARKLMPPGLEQLGSATLSDIVQSMATVQIDGDDGLWRAGLEASGKRSTSYLALDRGVAKVIGGPEALEGVGRYLLQTTDARHEARARRLLDWVRADVEPRTDLRAFKELWGQGLPSSRDAILLAAAVLAGASDAARVIPIAARCPSTAPGAAGTCQWLLITAYGALERWADALAQLEALRRSSPALSPLAAVVHASTLAGGGRFDEAERMLADVLAKDPAQVDALFARFWVAARRGDVPEALRRAAAVAQHPGATAVHLNNLAWFRLGHGTELTVALELARKAVEREPSANTLNTLAAIEVELGDLPSALRDNQKAIELGPSRAPQGADWYVIGRLHEQLGLVGDARAAYQRVAPVRSTEGVTEYELAQRRLAALRAR